MAITTERGALVFDVTTQKETSRANDLLASLKPLIHNGNATENSTKWQHTRALAGLFNRHLIRTPFSHRHSSANGVGFRETAILLAASAHKRKARVRDFTKYS
jgi:hypothetical protein